MQPRRNEHARRGTRKWIAARRRLGALGVAMAACTGLAWTAATGCAARPHSLTAPGQNVARATMQDAPSRGWQAELEREHPLVGRIFESADGADGADDAERAGAAGPEGSQAGRRVPIDALLRGLRSADYVLIGETHDNPDHHALEAEIVTALAPGFDAIAFEMLARSDQLVIDERVRSGASARDLARAVRWSESGWPEFGLYEPVFAAALASGLPLAAAGLSRAELAPLARGETVLGELAARYGLGAPLDATVRDHWLDDLEAAHCYVLPRASLGPMLEAQRLRDAALAEALTRAPRSIAIAGAGHVREDRGAPALIGARTATLAFVEVVAGRETLDAYRPLPYDFVWFTPAAERKDPCEALRASHGAAASADD